MEPLAVFSLIPFLSLIDTMQSEGGLINSAEISCFFYIEVEFEENLTFPAGRERIFANALPDHVGKGGGIFAMLSNEERSG